jgi:hypothetical protein
MSDRLVMSSWVSDNDGMEPSPQLEAFFELCQRMYERIQREGTWPWPPDSTLSKDVIDSESNPNNL